MADLLPALPAFSVMRLYSGGYRPGASFVRDKTVELPEEAARTFALGWARVAASPDGGRRCFVPQYEVSLLGDVNGEIQELFVATPCWRCRQLWFRGVGGVSGFFPWDSDQPEAAALLALFDSFIPYQRSKGPTDRCPECRHSWEGLPVGADCPGCKLTRWEERTWDSRP